MRKTHVWVVQKDAANGYWAKKRPANIRKTVGNGCSVGALVTRDVGAIDLYVLDSVTWTRPAGAVTGTCHVNRVFAGRPQGAFGRIANTRPDGRTPRKTFSAETRLSSAVSNAPVVYDTRVRSITGDDRW